MRPTSNLTIDVGAAQMHRGPSAISAALRSPRSPSKLGANHTTAVVRSGLPNDENMFSNNMYMGTPMFAINFTPVMGNFRSFMPSWPSHDGKLPYHSEFSQPLPFPPGSFAGSFPNCFVPSNAPMPFRVLRAAEQWPPERAMSFVNPRELWRGAKEAPEPVKPTPLSKTSSGQKRTRHRPALALRHLAQEIKPEPEPEPKKFKTIAKKEPVSGTKHEQVSEEELVSEQESASEVKLEPKGNEDCELEVEVDAESETDVPWPLTDAIKDLTESPISKPATEPRAPEPAARKPRKPRKPFLQISARAPSTLAISPVPIAPKPSKDSKISKVSNEDEDKWESGGEDSVDMSTKGIKYVTGEPAELFKGKRFRVRYHCMVCNRHYGDLKHLYRHQQVHVPRSPITCKWCQNTFTRHDTLRRHLNACTIRPVDYYVNQVPN